MTLTSFDDLLRLAREQPEPQRLLFVFAAAGIPEDATPAQRARFEAGEGGTLTPLVCLDRPPDELESFESLVAESREFGTDWTIVFVAALAGGDGLVATSEQAEAPLQQMVDSIEAGHVGRFLAFDTLGLPVQFY